MIRDRAHFLAAKTPEIRSNNSARRTYDLIRSTIHGGQHGARLVEDELTERLSASRNTVRAALQRVAEEGLVTRRTKVGTTARSDQVLLPFDAVGLPEWHEAHDRIDEAIVIPAPDPVADRLRLERRAEVLLVEGVVLTQSDALSVWAAYVRLGEDHPPQYDADRAPAFLEALLTEHNGGFDTVVSAVSADESTAASLGLGVGAPILWREVLWHDHGGRPTMLCHIHYRAERVALSGRMTASSSSPSRAEPA